MHWNFVWKVRDSVRKIRWFRNGIANIVGAGFIFDSIQKFQCTYVNWKGEVKEPQLKNKRCEISRNQRKNIIIKIGTNIFVNFFRFASVKWTSVCVYSFTYRHTHTQMYETYVFVNTFHVLHIIGGYVVRAHIPYSLLTTHIHPYYTHVFENVAATCKQRLRVKVYGRRLV